MQNRIALSTAILAATSLVTTGAHAQFYKIHNADVAVGALSPFTTVLTSNATNGNTERTTDTAGVLVSVREHPVAWAGVEFNYGYAKFSERFGYINGLGRASAVSVPTDMHEATGAYLFHPHFKFFQPFVGIGGGAISFVPLTQGYQQWRGTGLAEVGFDLPMKNPHMGFRAQGRSLIYRAPNFGTPIISTRSWVATSEPSVGVYYRF